MLTHLVQVQYCYHYLIDQIPVGLLVYSHIPTALVALAFGFYVLFKDRRLASIALAMVCAAFAAWCFLDLGSWFAFLGSGTAMFTWSLLDLFALVFFFFAYYFLHAFTGQAALPIWQKVGGLVLLLPTVVWTFLGLTLTGYDANTCEALEHETLTLYPYVVEGVFLIAVAVLAITRYRKATDKVLKAEIVLAGTGVALFLGFFFLSTLGVNVLVNATAVEFAYNFEIYGLFGMPILLGFLGYLIVRYHAFNLKVFAAQALVVALLALIAAEFAFVSSTANRVLVAVTLALTALAGVVLIRSVAREIKQRERIEALAQDLQASNGQLSEFMSLATHEIRNPATFIKGVAANILDGDMGAVTPTIRDAVQKIYVRAGDLLNLASQYLDKSKLELNQLTYTFTAFDLCQLVRDLAREFEPAAEQRGITVTAKLDAAQSCMVEADQGKLKEVIGNLIDNAIKYTPKGSVTVLVVCGEGTATVKITDTGVGMPAEIVPHLFQKFSRADAQRMNLLGTGLGLYLAMVFIDAHHGRIWVESAGKDRGSTFFVEIPLTQPAAAAQANSAGDAPKLAA